MCELWFVCVCVSYLNNHVYSVCGWSLVCFPNIIWTSFQTNDPCYASFFCVCFGFWFNIQLWYLWAHLPQCSLLLSGCCIVCVWHLMFTFDQLYCPGCVVLVLSVWLAFLSSSQICDAFALKRGEGVSCYRVPMLAPFSIDSFMLILAMLFTSALLCWLFYDISSWHYYLYFVVSC